MTLSRFFAAPTARHSGIGGFSYIEMLIALSIFAVLVLSVLPLLSHVGRNLAVAESHYSAFLAAQNISLAVRDSLTSNFDIYAAESVAKDYAEHLDLTDYTVWIFYENVNPYTFFTSSNAPEINISADGVENLVVVAVWNEHGHIIGRAISPLPPRPESVVPEILEFEEVRNIDDIFEIMHNISSGEQIEVSVTRSSASTLPIGVYVFFEDGKYRELRFSLGGIQLLPETANILGISQMLDGIDIDDMFDRIFSLALNFKASDFADLNFFQFIASEFDIELPENFENEIIIQLRGKGGVAD